MTRDDETNPALTEIQRATARERWAEHGLYLEENVLNKIYTGNFTRLAGQRPRPVNISKVLAACEELTERVRRQPDDHEQAPHGRSPAEVKAQNLEELAQITEQLRRLA